MIHFANGMIYFDGAFNQGLIIWAGVFVVFGMFEVFMGRMNFRLMVGAAVAAVLALLGATLLLQAAVFVVVSLPLTLLARARAKKKQEIEAARNKADPRIGKEALVVAEITPFNFGQAKVDGNVCMAVAKDQGTRIKRGTTVRIEGVDGVELIVSPVDSTNQLGAGYKMDDHLSDETSRQNYDRLRTLFDSVIEDYSRFEMIYAYSEEAVPVPEAGAMATAVRYHNYAFGFDRAANEIVLLYVTADCAKHEDPYYMESTEVKKAKLKDSSKKLLIIDKRLPLGGVELCMPDHLHPIREAMPNNAVERSGF